MQKCPSNNRQVKVIGTYLSIIWEISDIIPKIKLCTYNRLKKNEQPFDISNL